MSAPRSVGLGALVAAPAVLLAGALVLLLLLPALGLLLASSPAQLWGGVRHPLFLPASWLSARTSLLALLVVALTGTPLAWFLSRGQGALSRLLESLVDLPVVVPPAVIGVALLTAFGRQGLLGPALDGLGIALPFTTAAVVVAQAVVSAPFYVAAATQAFRQVDPELLDVARTLGASRTRAVLSVAVPVALPGLVSGLALAWARSLGEFGATLLFAGNLAGVTQTLPLAIYTALESDVRVAVALSLALVAVALLALVGLRSLPALLWRRG